MKVTLEVNSVRYSGWKNIRIERSMEALSGAFSLGITEKWPGQAVARGVNPGDDCKVRIDEDVVITGFVDDTDPEIDADNHDIDVTGRDYSGDLVDCSAIHKPGQWHNQKLEKIVQELVAPYANIKVITDVNTGEPFKKFAIEQGETVHEAIARMCKLRAVLAFPDGKGNILITAAGRKRTKVALIEGPNGNIKKIKGHFSHKERHSIIYVKGQTQGSDQHAASITTSWKGKATDSEIKRHRPLLVMAEGQADGKHCQERAQWEAATRKAKGQNATITVQGWRQGDSEKDPVWDINTLVFCSSPSAKSNGTFLISGVVFTLDENGGQVTEITLVKPDAFKLIREPEPK
jgi:prophage tail gpP-like protein